MRHKSRKIIVNERDDLIAMQMYNIQNPYHFYYFTFEMNFARPKTISRF